MSGAQTARPPIPGVATSRLLAALQFWRENDATDIHMSALATDDSEETIGDLIDAALAEQASAWGVGTAP